MTNFSTPSTFPIIDLAPFLNPNTTSNFTKQQRQIANQLCTCAKTLGFFYIQNHNICPFLLQTLQHYARQFFTQPAHIKERYAMNHQHYCERKMNIGRGYQRIGENITNGERDLCEAIDFMKELKDDEVIEESKNGNTMNEMVKLLGMGKNIWVWKGLKRIVEEYVEELRKIAIILMRIIELGLGIHNWYEKLTKVVEDQDGFWIMRMIWYPSIIDEHDNNGNNVQGRYGCGVHKDYGFLTFVLQDETKGCLQVQKPDGSWVNADPIPGTFVVNIGDCLQRLTGNILKSTPHRVLRNEKNGPRLSIPCFIEPNFLWKLNSEEMNSLETDCYQSDDDPFQGFETYGAYLYSKVSTNFDFTSNDTT